MPFVWVGLHRGTQGFRRPSFRILPEFRDNALDWMTFRSVELAQRRLFVRALMDNQKKPRMLALARRSVRLSSRRSPQPKNRARARRRARARTSWEIAEQGRECQFPTPALESSMGPSQFDHEKLDFY